MKKFFPDIFSIFKPNRKGQYPFSLREADISTSFNSFGTWSERINIALSNPALMKVIALQCDLFSLGKIYVKRKSDGEDLPDDLFLRLIKNPNPFQSQSQFLWDMMFWEMLGNCYTYIQSKVLTSENKMYNLDPSKIEWPTSLQHTKDYLILTKGDYAEILNKQIKYCYDNGKYQTFPLSRVMITHDLTNGIGNWMQSPSRITNLMKVISNSEYALDAKNINIRYSAKFLVASDRKSGEILPLSEDEKQDIESKIDDDKSVRASKSMLHIRRYVENMAHLELDDAYLADYFTIGSMYGIPRDVLEAYQSSTYENQEQARASHVSYTLDPKGNDIMNQFEKHFGYDNLGLDIYIDWSHLPFTQVFEKTKSDTLRVKIQSLKELLDLGYDLESAKILVDLE